jgi:hypothetical protein
MPNAIKYNVSAETLALKKGNFWIGTGDVGKGPTSSTGYYNGITPPSGGYTIYLNKVSGGPSIYTVTTEAQMVSLTNSIGSQSFTTSGQCLNWFATQTDKMIFNIDYPAIVTNGLVMNLDAGFTPSYPTLNTTWYDISSGGNNGTLTNGPTYSSSNGGSIVFDGVDDYVPTLVSVTNWAVQPFTISSFFKWSTGASNANYGFFELAGSGGSNWGMSHVPRSGNFYFYWLKDGVNEGHAASSDLIQDNVTLNITITFNGVPANSGQQTLYDNTKIYMNGVEVPHSAAGSAGVTSSSTLFVGGTQYPMKGNIYNFLYYTRPLSSIEVLQNYNAQKGRFGL